MTENEALKIFEDEVVIHKIDWRIVEKGGIG